MISLGFPRREKKPSLQLSAKTARSVLVYQCSRCENKEGMAIASSCTEPSPTPPKLQSLPQQLGTGRTERKRAADDVATLPPKCAVLRGCLIV